MKNLFVCFLLLITSSVYADTDKVFEKLFTEWTQAFNRKDLPASCHLFAKSVVANYRGVPQKNYSDICNGFKKVFQDNQLQYHYRFKIKEVYQSKNLAAVRITWYLEIKKNNKIISSVQDEGLDVLQKNKQDQWQIINYLAYS